MSTSQRLEDDDQQILQSALSDAFSPPPLVVQPAEAPSDAQATFATAAVSPEVTSSSSSDSEAWKAEYEAQVQSWREQSAASREQAERERARWEAIRAAEKQEAALRGPEPKQPLSEVEVTSSAFSAVPSSESPTSVDSRDLATGEPQKQTAPPSVPTVPSSEFAHVSTTSRADTVDKWEDIPSSLTSSFPSMSFPEHTGPSSPARKPQAADPVRVNPSSATLSVFDTSLSSRTRIKALLSSVAINLLLPFVNGVMLGFGEIFAKNVILGWFGWNKPPRTGRVATTTGIGVAKPFDFRSQSR